MLNSAHQPVSVVVTRTDAHGKRSQSGTVQALEKLYVQREDGQWHSVDLSIKDKVDVATDELKTAKLICQRVGVDTVGATGATVYALHVDNDEVISDARLWISSGALILRSDSSANGAQYSAVYDYAHVNPPAHATQDGSK
jgi:hypothetical protein